MKPEDLAELLTEHLGTQTTIVFRHRASSTSTSATP
jgi:hypothetical protein